MKSTKKIPPPPLYQKQISIPLPGFMYCFDFYIALRNKRGTFIIRGPAAGNKAIFQLAKYCSNLEAFVMLRCNNFTNDRIRYLARKCTGISTFCLQSDYFTDTGLTSLAEFLPQLKYLNIKGCEKLTSKSFQEIGNKLPNLKELYMENCKNVDDEGIKALAQNCHTIESLSIASCFDLTDESIFFIAACLPGLKFLNMTRINLSDIALHRLAQFCTQLETLHISQLPLHVTPEGLCKLIRHSPHLKILDISLCEHIVDDNVIFVIGQTCSNMQELNLIGCAKLTDQALITLGLRCRGLEVLNVSSISHHFTLDCLWHLKLALPNLKVTGADDINFDERLNDFND